MDKVLIFIFLISVGCVKGQVYQRSDHSGERRFTFNSDSTYYFWYHRTLLSIDDTLEHRGRFIKEKDTISCTSYIQFSTKNLYVCSEYQTNSDSLTIVFIPDDGMFSFMLPEFIRINNDYGALQKGDSVVYIAKKTDVNWIVFGVNYTSHYPIYFPKNRNSDYFSFLLKDIDRSRYAWFPMYSYFFKEKFLMKGDSLIPIQSNKLLTSRLLNRIQSQQKK